MARAPFSNTLPDYLVTGGPRFGALGATVGGVLAAGFFGNRWELSERWGASYSAIDCWKQG